MKLTDLFIRRPVLAIVVNLVILIAGLQSVRALSVRQYPRSDVAVVRVGSRGAPDVFYRKRLGPGRTGVSLAGRPAAYPLEGLDGPQRFVLVAAEEPLTPARIAAAAAALAPPARISAEAPALDGLSLDVVEVTVR